MTVQLEVVSPLKLLEQDLVSVMADQQFTDSGSSPGSSSDCAAHGPGSASETSMWEEWTQATNSAVGDEVSTSNFLSDLTTSNSTSSGLSFQQSDMLSTWMSSFHPLTPTTDPIDQCQPSFMQHDLDHPIDAADALPLVYESKTTGVSRQLLRALGPLSPSSPLVIHNGLLNPLGDPWDGQWTSARGSTFFLDHSASAVEHLEDITPKPRHTDVFIGPNGTFESATPGGWTPQLLFDRSEEVKPVAPMKLMASLREAGEVTSCADPREIGSLVDLRSREDLCCVATNSSSAVTMADMLVDCQRRPQIANIDSTMTTTWPRKHRLELLKLVDAEADQPLLKRAKTVNSVEETKLLQSWSDIQTYCSASGVAGLASQAMDIIAIGPALNTNGKPRARRGSATDPQSVYARHRREKINERLKNLQNLVPNGAKVDIVTMLEEAIHYVKFLQNQVELLKSDDYWMYATPNNYNGMDLSELSQELESSA